MSHSIEVSHVIPASPNAIYEAWLNEDEHADGDHEWTSHLSPPHG